MKYYCVVDRLELTSEITRDNHLKLFPMHLIVEIKDEPAKDKVGMSDSGYVILKGPDGKIKQRVELN